MDIKKNTRRRPKDDPGLELAIVTVGSMSELARRLGISPSAIALWERVPPIRVPAVASASGLPKHVIRPDLHDAPESRNAA